MRKENDSMRYGIRLMITVLSVILLGAVSGAAETARPQPDSLAKAVHEIENLDALRSGLPDPRPVHP